MSERLFGLEIDTRKVERVLRKMDDVAMALDEEDKLTRVELILVGKMLAEMTMTQIRGGAVEDGRDPDRVDEELRRFRVVTDMAAMWVVGKASGEMATKH